jgi:hypothetical protein
MEKSKKNKFVIVRTYSAGVHAGYLEKQDGKIITLRNAIRIWQWDGAASLSQLAMEGVKKPENCKFAMPVNEIILTEAIEVITATEKARKNIEGIKSWKI